MMRTLFAGIASAKDLTEARGATLSAVLTIASVGADRVDGLTSMSPIFRVPRKKRFSR